MLGSAATLSAIILYMASSAGMTIVNKLAVRALPLPLLVTVVQMLFTVLCLVAVPALRKAVHFGSARDAWRWGRAIPPLFAMMLATSMLALRHASMGAVVVVRSIAPLPTLAVEALCGEKVRVDAATVLSLLLGVAGVLLYSRHDIQFSSAGLCWLGANTLAAVLERLLQRHMIAVEPIDVSKQGMMLINNGVGALLVLPIALATGEGSKLLQPPDAGESTGGASSGGAIVLDAHAAVLLLLSCINGMVISYAGLNVQAHVTATAMLVLNNSCKFVVVAFGVFVLNEASSPQSVVGCTAALGAGLLYAHARIESILTKSGKDVAALFAAAGASIDLATPFDRDLAQHIVRFRDRLDYMMEELLPSVMCEYLHDLAQKLTTFYQNCPVLNGKTEADLALVDSRLRLLHTTAVTMRAAFHILALKPLYKI